MDSSKIESAGMTFRAWLKAYDAVKARDALLAEEKDKDDILTK